MKKNVQKRIGVNASSGVLDKVFLRRAGLGELSLEGFGLRRNRHSRRARKREKKGREGERKKDEEGERARGNLDREKKKTEACLDISMPAMQRPPYLSIVSRPASTRQRNVKTYLEADQLFVAKLGFPMRYQKHLSNVCIHGNTLTFSGSKFATHLCFLPDRHGRTDPERAPVYKRRRNQRTV